MKMRHALAAAALLASVPAWAGGYFGLALTGTQANGDSDIEDDLSNAIGGAGFFGYRFSMPVPLFVEADYTDSGKLDIDQSNASLQFRGPALFAGAYFPLDRRERFRLWGKIGYAQTDALFNDDRFAGDFAGEEDNGFVWAVGGDFAVSRLVAIRAEFRQYTGMFEEVGSGLELDLNTLRMGVVLEFGAAAPPRPARPVVASSPRTDAPVTPPPPVVASPPPISAAAPRTMAIQESAPPPLATGMARTLVATPLQDRPLPGDPATAMIPAGTQVQVQARVSNAQGKWCFVGYQGKTGWVRAEALGS